MSDEEREDRRRYPRYEISWPVRIEAGGETIAAETRDIGADGISIFCEEGLRLNETYRFSIHPEPGPGIRIEGTVVWSELYALERGRAAVGMGICFVELSEKDREAWMDFISRAD